MMNSNFYLGRPTTSVDCIVAVNGRGSLMRTGAVYNTAVCAVCVGVWVWGGGFEHLLQPNTVTG